MPTPWPAARLAGWALGSLVVMSLITAHTLIDIDQRRAEDHLTLRSGKWIRVAIVAVGVTAAALHAYAFATATAS